MPMTVMFLSKIDSNGSLKEKVGEVLKPAEGLAERQVSAECVSLQELS